MKSRILIVEDDQIMGESLLDRFRLEGYEPDWHASAESALEALKTQRYGLVLSDLRLPGMGGRALLGAIRALLGVPPPMILITGYGSINDAVGALKEGASDYITKPFDLNQLVEKVGALCLPNEEGGDCPPLGVSPAMQQIEALLPRIAAQARTVLISGESGVGKECIARRVHDLACGGTPRPFLPLNCAALPETLLEAELFGFEKGAFTGAARNRTGLFEAAGQGSLFLDEIGEMNPAVQAKLLRAVQEREVMRIGSQTPQHFDARLIFATNRDLRTEVEQGRFREDLFYRINVIHIRIPPLRERHEDIPWLAQGFVAELSRQHGSRRVLSPQALEAIQLHDWPGNVRELRHAIERACIMTASPVIQAQDLREARLRAAANGTPASGTTETTYDLSAYLQSCEREFILEALRAHDGKMIQTAKVLGISRKSLWDKMRRLGLKTEDAEMPS